MCFETLLSLFFLVSPNSVQCVLFRVGLEIDKFSRNWWYEWGKGGSKARSVGGQMVVVMDILIEGRRNQG